ANRSPARDGIGEVRAKFEMRREARLGSARRTRIARGRGVDEPAPRVGGGKGEPEEAQRRYDGHGAGVGGAALEARRAGGPGGRVRREARPTRRTGRAGRRDRAPAILDREETGRSSRRRRTGRIRPCPPKCNRMGIYDDERSRVGGRMALRERTIPSDDEYLSWRERFCNWGRWGADDENGTLNFITDAVRVSASGLV